MKIKINPIGYIKNDFKTVEDLPRQSFIRPEYLGELVIEEDLVPAFKGLEAGDKILVLWNFKQSNPEEYKDRMAFENSAYFEGSRGIFATRTPFRPNGIGLSEVVIKEIKGNKILVSGIDMLDGSPIIDIKPSVIKRNEENHD